MADGQIVFEISADGKKATAAINDITRELKAAGAKWEDTAEQSSDNMQKSFQKAFNVERVKNWAIAAAKAIGDFAKASIQAASDLEEVQNVVDTTFGDSAGQINSWAQNAIKQFGLTETQAKRFASTMGAMMKSSGVASDDIVKMSEDLSGLAADMASFYNLDFDTAFQKIRSGISGETEPLKQLGINMSVANLNAFALKQGLEKTFEQMTQGEQTMLRYQYIMQATADAQGDFARTSDGFANSQRLLASNIDAIKAKFGEILKGPLAELTTWANDTLSKYITPSSTTVLDTFNDIKMNTEAKLAEIDLVSDKANDLIGVLNDIASAKVDSSNFTQAATDIASGLQTMGIQAVLAKNNKYAETVSGLAASMSEITGTPKGDWETLLKEIGNNLPKANSATAEETTSAFLSAAAIAANKLGGGYPALWKQLVDTLGSESATAMLTMLADAQAGANLGIIADNANKLNASSKSHWEGVLTAISTATGTKFTSNTANAKEKISALAKALSGDSLDTTRAEAFKGLITDLKDNASALTELTGTDETGVIAFLNGLANAANTLDPNNAEGWDVLLTALAQGLTGGLGTEGGNNYFSALSEYFLAMGNDSKEAVDGLKALGYTEEEITQAQEDWLVTVKQLKQTIPGLADVVNDETGEVKGGTEALKEYVEEWRKEQEALVMWSAHYAKQRALAEAEGSIAGYRVAAGGAHKAVERLTKEVETLFGDLYGDLGSEDQATRFNAMIQVANRTGMSIDDVINKVAELETAQTKAEAADAEYQKQVEANAEAVQQLSDEYDYLVDKYGDYEQAAKDAENAAKGSTSAEQEAAEAVQKHADAVKDALLAVQDYAEGVRKATENAVEGVLDTFKQIETPADKTRKELKDLQKKIDNAKKDAKEGLQISYSAKEGEIPTIANMARGLQSQLEYMREYQRLMQEARAKGVSEEILTMLADGSTQSFDYLQALASGVGDIDHLNQIYKDVQDEAKNFTDTLTEQKLSTDETFKSLVDTANKAMEDLDKSEAAKNAAVNTMKGLIDGFTELEPDLKATIADIMTIVGQLSGTFGGFNFNGSNSISFTRSTKSETLHSNANGLNYVPFDNYFSILHEGEAILNAEEAKIWRDFRSGYESTRNVDYDTLGGLMRDNVKAGGNVYLDGQTVGRVISARQGDSYRALERSGWQS